MKEKLIIITGPTGVGKTKISIALAKAVNGEVISADSVQVFCKFLYHKVRANDLDLVSKAAEPGEELI